MRNLRRDGLAEASRPPSLTCASYTVPVLPSPPMAPAPTPALARKVPRWEETAAATGAAFLELAGTVGGMGVLFGRLVVRMFPPRLDGPELRRNLHKMAVKSMPIVVVTALFT